MSFYFLEPQFWYVAVVCFAIVALRILLWTRLRAARATFAPDGHRMHDIPMSSRAFVLHTLGMLVLALFLVLGLMHPVQKTIVMEPRYESAATMIALDISKSQRAESGYYGTPEGRLGAIKQTFLNLLSASQTETRKRWQFWKPEKTRLILEGQRIGVVVFAGEAYTLLTPTDRRETLYRSLKHVTSDDMVMQGTNFDAALEESLLAFTEQDKIRTIILITDGEESTSVPVSLERKLQRAREMGVRIFTVVVGHARAPLGDIYWTEPSMELPRYIAQATDGEVFAYDERGKLYPVLERIFADVQESSKQPVEHERDLRPWLAFIFLIAFAGAALFQYAKR